MIHEKTLEFHITQWYFYLFEPQNQKHSQNSKSKSKNRSNFKNFGLWMVRFINIVTGITQLDCIDYLQQYRAIRETCNLEATTAFPGTRSKRVLLSTNWQSTIISVFVLLNLTSSESRGALTYSRMRLTSRRLLRLLHSSESAIHNCNGKRKDGIACRFNSRLHHRW